MQGVLEEYNGTFSLLNLLECIYYEDQAAYMLYIGVETFQQGLIDYKAGKDIETILSDVAGGAIAVVGAVQQFRQGLPICEAIDTSSFDFKPLDEGLDFAAHPQKHMEIISKDLVVHGVSIFEDIEKANLDYKDGNYKEFGKTIAKIMKLVTVAQEAKLKA